MKAFSMDSNSCRANEAPDQAALCPKTSNTTVVQFRAPMPTHDTHFSSLFLPCRCRFAFRCFFPIAPYHDHTQKATHDGGAEEDQDDWDANGPDARREEVVRGVAGIDEGLVGRSKDFESVKKNRTRREEPRMKPRVREGKVEGDE